MPGWLDIREGLRIAFRAIRANKMRSVLTTLGIVIGIVSVTLMATAIEGARLLCLKAAWLKDEHQNYDLAAAMAKLYASEIAQWVTNEAIQIHGGYGYVKEFHVERLMRDAKITQIYEGTSEVQKIVISRTVLKD